MAMNRSAKLLITRAIVALISASLIGMALFMLYKVRIDYHWSMVGEAYKPNPKRNNEIELPLAIRLLWPIAPFVWWSVISPVAIGLTIAATVRRPVAFSTLLLAACGAFVFISAIWGSFATYVKMAQYMGNPPYIVWETSCTIGNILLVSGSLAAFGWTIRRGMWRAGD